MTKKRKKTEGGEEERICKMWCIREMSCTPVRACLDMIAARGEERERGEKKKERERQREKKEKREQRTENRETRRFSTVDSQVDE